MGSHLEVCTPGDHSNPIGPGDYILWPSQQRESHRMELFVTPPYRTAQSCQIAQAHWLSYLGTDNLGASGCKARQGPIVSTKMLYEDLGHKEFRGIKIGQTLRKLALALLIRL